MPTALRQQAYPFGSLRTDAHWSVQGLVFHPNFRPAGIRLVDESPYKNHGTLIGDGLNWQGDALDFAGSGDYIDCGTSVGDVLGNGNKNVSVSIRFKADDVASNKGLFTIGDFSSTQGELAILLFGNNIRFRMDSGVFFGLIAFLDTTFYHNIVVTYDGVAGKLYLDDVLSINEPYNSGLDFAGLKTIIGGYYNSGFTHDGKVSDVKIYNRALSASEIQQLNRNSGLPFQTYPEWWGQAAAVGVNIPVMTYHYKQAGGL